MSPEPRLLVIGRPDRTAPIAAALGAVAVDRAGAPGAMAGTDAALCLTEPGESPWGLATALYLAGVPHRIGRSAEFGGSLLTRCLPADASDAALAAALQDVLPA